MNNSRHHVHRILIVFLFMAIPLYPTVAGGSTYSRFGVGDLVRYGGGRLNAMGGTGIALTGDGFLNLLNPAGIGKILHTRFSGGFEYTNFNSTDAFGSGRYARGNFEGVAFGIPVDKEYGVALLFEASPYSNVNYSTLARDSVVEQDFYGTGGLSLLTFGGSVSPVKRLSLGANLNYIHGRIRQAVNFKFTDPTFLNSEIQRSDFYSGYNFTIGGIYEGVGDLLSAPSLQPLSIGFVLSTPATLSVNRESLLTTSESTDTTATNAGNVEIPVAFGAGFSYLIGNQYYITGDVYHQQWQNAKFFGSTSPVMRNSTRISVGFESLQQRETDPFLKKIAYRAGFYYNASSYFFNGTPINELALTGGVGVPIGPDARLDIGLTVGTRGSTSNNLQRDTIFRLSISVSASEAWFMKVEEE
jgi:hypothetical protein